MTIRSPPGVGDASYPDGTSYISQVERSNNRQIQTRADLPDNQSRLTFNLVLDEEPSPYATVQSPIEPGESQALYTAELGEEMPYSPVAGANLTLTQVATSFRSPCQIRAYINDALQSTVFLEAGGYTRAQVAGLAELVEGVNELDGENEILWEIVNLSNEPLEGSISLRAVEIVMEQ